MRYDLFSGFDVVEYTGSYSIKRDGQTVAKIIPRANSVFVGVRETESPSHWFSGPLEAVSVQGVTFFGVYVPAETPDAIEAAHLASGLRQQA